jgi:hypothetical protein
MIAGVAALKARCFWEVVIRPRVFVERRVANRHLALRIVRGATVTYQGFRFPHVTEGDAEQQGDWIGQFHENFYELWRAYLSGQFYNLSGHHSDWGWRHQLSPFERIREDEPFMGVGYALYRFTLIFEYAARLAFTEMGDDEVHVEVVVGNLARRRLVSDDPNRAHLMSHPTAGLDDFKTTRELARAELAADPRSLARNAAAEFFTNAFDTELPEELLSEWQTQWLRR